MWQEGGWRRWGEGSGGLVGWVGWMVVRWSGGWPAAGQSGLSGRRIIKARWPGLDRAFEAAWRCAVCGGVYARQLRLTLVRNRV